MTRKLFPLVVLLVFQYTFISAQSLGIRSQQLTLDKKSFIIDSLTIIKHTVTVRSGELNYIEGVNFEIDYFHSIFININIPEGTLISIRYSPVLFDFKKVYQNKDLSIIQPEFKEIKNPFLYQPGKNTDLSIISDGLQINGSLMRGLSLGNNQNVVVNSNLNLQMAGKLNNDIDVVAAISDENNPIQPEGNTQTLQDFDKVYMKLAKNNTDVTIGDYEMQRPKGIYFLNYFKKSRGAQVNTLVQINRKDTLSLSASAAISRGRFVRNTINGIEGNQGPYRLSGPNGEMFIIIISGTEAIYLDGEKLSRGEQNDYIIDYNSGEITFMPKRIITQYSRVVAEFQYSDRNYARSVFNVNSSYDIGKITFRGSYFSEQDHKNQPFQQLLSDSNKRVLANSISPKDALVSGAIPVSAFSKNKIMYKKIDTSGFKDVFIYAAEQGADSLFYEVRFSFVGKGNGNYVQSSSSANGRVFKWLAPQNNIMQGDFEPVLLLVAPNRMQMITMGADIKVSENNFLSVELARSELNRNLFSETGHSNDAGYGIKLGFANKINLKQNSIVISNEAGYEHVDKNFRFVERYRNVEFDRNWNRQIMNQSIQDTGYDEHILSFKTNLRKKNLGTLAYHFNFYDRAQSLFRGFQQQLQTSIISGHNIINAEGEYLSTSQKIFYANRAYSNSTQRMKLDYGRQIFNFIPGVRIKSERSAFINAKDSLLINSFSFNEYGAYLKNTDSTNLGFVIDYSVRSDYLPKSNEFVQNSESQNIFAALKWIQKNQNRLNLNFNYRQFSLKDTLAGNLKPENTLLTRIEYDYSIFKRFISANTYLQFGSGNELKRDFQYLEVPVGLGVYVWRDFNNDGLQQVNEFVVASLADKNLANFIKVFLPTNSIIRTNSSQLNQTLNINPSNLLSRKYAINRFVNRFSNQTSFRFERKNLSTPDILILNPFSNNLNDSLVISQYAQFRSTLFYNLANPDYGIDFTYSENNSKNLLTNGFETRNQKVYETNMRWNIDQYWSLNFSYNEGNRYSISDYFNANSFDYSLREIKPKINYQFSHALRISINGGYSEYQNKPQYGQHYASSKESGVELRYNFKSLGILSAKYTLLDITFNGDAVSVVAYEMMQGLNRGKNQVWNLNLTQRIGTNLQINFTYDGRISENSNAIHTGRMEARYIF